MAAETVLPRDLAVYPPAADACPDTAPPPSPSVPDSAWTGPAYIHLVIPRIGVDYQAIRQPSAEDAIAWLLEPIWGTARQVRVNVQGRNYRCSCRACERGRWCDHLAALVSTGLIPYDGGTPVVLSAIGGVE